jgi:NAD dependent epimerase/dehydratase
MRLNGKTVLVTGAGGFIGSHLVEALLAQNCHVKALVKYNSRGDLGHLESLSPQQQAALEIFSGDIADPFFVASAVSGCDVVFHLAALIGIPYSYIAPQHYVNVNIQGTLNILESCRKAGIEKLVHTSTSETYGSAQFTPITESHPLQGQSPYSASKIAADKMVESYVLSYNLPAAIIRPFNAFGPRQSARAIIPTIITQALNYSQTQHPVKLGALSPKRDFSFVRDTVEGFIKIAESDQSIGEVINIGSGQAYSIGETLQIILRLLNQPDLPISLDSVRMRPDKSEVSLLLADNQKAKTLTGWEPQFTFEAGLEETIQYLRLNLGKYKPLQYSV